MGDNATEIDLDSVIDRLLEGTSPLFAHQFMICWCRVTYRLVLGFLLIVASLP
jgi:hypothetical protein